MITIAQLLIAAPLFLTGARIEVGDGNAIEGGSIVIDGGRITAVGARVPKPADAETIDVSGKVVTPGFVAVSSTLGLVEVDLEERTRDNVEWKNLEADLAELRKLRSETTVSLNEEVRRKERDEQEARSKARDLAAAGSATPDTDPATRTREKINAEADRRLGKTEAESAGQVPDADTLRDDGLQPDERSISTEIAREEKAKDRRDVVLEETAHILADEIGLIRSDTKLAAQVLPRGVVVPTEVD